VPAAHDLEFLGAVGDAAAGAAQREGDGRMIAGNPTASSASAPRRARRRAGFWRTRPILSIAWRNSWRSSALAIASSLAPISSTVLRQHPRAGQRHRGVERGLAALVGSSASIGCPAWRSRMICSTRPA
jgi:hypothetical protein